VFAQKVLEHFELTNYFSGIAGSNLDNTRSDKTEIIAHVLTKYKLEVSNSGSNGHYSGYFGDVLL
jgi:phosphoglycolate phosphatase